MVRVAVSLEQLGLRTPGGIATYERELWRALCERDDATNFVAVTARSTPDLLPGDIRRSPLPSSLLIRAWGHRAVGLPSSDVVHAGSIAGPLATSARSSVMLHDLLWRRLPSTFTPRGVTFHEERWQRFRRSASLIMVTNELLRDEVLADGVSADRVYVAPLGHRALSPDVPAALALLETHGVVGNFTLTVGSIEPRKNHARLIAAHAAARARDGELGPLVIVGPRGWGDVDLSGGTWLGSVDAGTLGGLYELARVVAYVPLAEGWGLPVIEALSAGRPVAASQSTPSAIGRVDVALSDPLDGESIAAALLTALRRDDSSSAQEVRRDSVRALSWAACAGRHVEVWNCA